MSQVISQTFFIASNQQTSYAVHRIRANLPPFLLLFWFSANRARVFLTFWGVFALKQAIDW